MSGRGETRPHEAREAAISTPNHLTFVMLPPQGDVTRAWAERLAADFPGVEIVLAETEEDALAAMPRAEAAYGRPTAEMLAAAPRLRWLQAPQAAPPAGFYSPELVAHPVTVTNMRAIYGDHIGAHIMAYVLAFARGLQIYYPRQLAREWKPEPHNTGIVDLRSATALVVGVGDIGAEAARLCAAFGMTVIGTDGRTKVAPPGVSELHPPEALDDLLPRADFVIATIPHTPATEGLFDRARFRRMKPSAFFINIGRGMTTRIDDLAAAIEAGEIAGAGLDVFEIEPLPADHPLWTLPGVILTPHVAGFGPHLDERRYEIIRDNLGATLNGGTLRNVVDKEGWF